MNKESKKAIMISTFVAGMLLSNKYIQNINFDEVLLMFAINYPHTLQSLHYTSLISLN